MTKPKIPSLDPSYVAYLTSTRDFVVPLVEQAVAALELPAGARVLDLGTGGGGALAPLARAVGPSGSVLAVDHAADAVALAGEHAERAGFSDQVTVRAGDITEVLADAATAPEKAFDAIWGPT